MASEQPKATLRITLEVGGQVFGNIIEITRETLETDRGHIIGLMNDVAKAALIVADRRLPAAQQVAG
ncbi:MAG: hypothetical protein KGQ52_13360 [Alphaproteobacteria bacterium]|nr:hypothetical protein [Alphaproteobacteria bacterium]